MTKEQWLVYIWSIYPEGGYQAFWIVSLIISVVLLAFSYIVASDYNFREDTTWVKLGKWKLLPLFFLITAILLTEYNFWYGVLSSAITLMTIASGIQFGGYILSKYD